MKKLLSTAFVGILIAASTPAAKAFSFDFSTVANGPLPVTVNVLGYGDVTFTLIGGNAQVGESLGTKTIEMSPASVLTVSFPTPVFDATFTFIDLDGTQLPNDQVAVVGDFAVTALGVVKDITDSQANTDNQVISPEVDSSAGLIVLSLSDQSIAGLKQVNFNAIPEPSSALLAAIGAIAMLARRRR